MQFLCKCYYNCLLLLSQIHDLISNFETVEFLNILQTKREVLVLYKTILTVFISLLLMSDNLYVIYFCILQLYGTGSSRMKPPQLVDADSSDDETDEYDEHTVVAEEVVFHCVLCMT